MKALIFGPHGYFGHVPLKTLNFSLHGTSQVQCSLEIQSYRLLQYPLITYYWTRLLILDHPYLVGNLTNSKIAETEASEPVKS
jgi:hypothetical protein